MLEDNATGESVYKSIMSIPEPTRSFLIKQINEIEAGQKPDPRITTMLLADLMAEMVELKKLLRYQSKQIKSLKMVCEVFAKESEDEHESLVKEVEGLDKRERLLSIAENNLEIDKMKLELQMTKESKVEMLELVDKVFGHPSVTINNSKTTSSRLVPNEHYLDTNILTDSDLTTKTEGKR